jgi:hypothetical protein
MRTGVRNVITSVIRVPAPWGSKRCSCLNAANGPLTISSTNRRGGSNSTMREVIRQVTPKWRASHVTSSPP